MVAQSVAGVLFFRDFAPFPSDGPLDAGQALLLVNLIDAIILVLLAGRARLRGWALGLMLGGLLFGVQVFQAEIETLMFNGDIHMSRGLLVAILWSGLLRDALAVIGIALLWRGRGALDAQVEGLAWKAPAIAILYVFYLIDQTGLLALQFGRGLIWSGLAWLVLRSLSGPVWRTALLTGLAFSGLMIPQLLFPNPLMPWPVRAVHMVEVGISNFLFGALAIWILCFRIGRVTAPA
ncbi:MAG: hypothetical protein JF628_11060 [Sphingomonas sp.]|nr:hypothetical protein [Sphingomonas sp.]